MRFPRALKQLFDGNNRISAPTAVAAILNEWVSDVSSLDKQRAALRRQEEEVSSEKTAVQHLIVGMAGMAKFGSQGLVDAATKRGALTGISRSNTFLLSAHLVAAGLGVLVGVLKRASRRLQAVRNRGVGAV
jgi:hypothetical protein